MIIKNIIIILLVIPIILFSQEKSKEQSIELPEFVITGVQKIKIHAVKKHKPKLIPVLNNKYYKPYISPEKLSLSEFSKPRSVKILVHKKQQFYRGYLAVGAGIYTQPTGKFNYHLNKGFTHLFANISGINVRDYVPFSKYNDTKFKLGGDFNISHNSAFLPGSQFSVQGNYQREQYYLYASSTPGFERKNEYADGELKIQNYSSKKFNYIITGKIKNTKFHENNFEETVLRSGAFFKYNWDKVSLSASGIYKTQSLKNNLILSKNNLMYGGKLLLNINPSKTISANFGTVYSKQDTNLLFSPIIELMARIDKNLTLIAKYEPAAEFETISDFQNKNRYLKKFNFNNRFVMNNTDFTLAIRYQFYKYFEINGGANYQVIENMPYFEGGINPSDLELKTSNYVKKAAIFLNLLFYKGPYGHFFGNVKLQDVKFRDGNRVPYEPWIKTDMTYGFNVTTSVELEMMLKYFSKSYMDGANTKEIPAYINAAVALKYSLTKNLEFNVHFENILNRNNFLYVGYKEKPFDVVGGINYRW